MVASASESPAFFRGAWIVPGQPEYEAARAVFNQRVDAQPVVIARCAGVADVVSAVAYARERGLRIDVRSTGTNLGGISAGGEMVIDLSLMRGVQILPEQRFARIQGGVSGGDLQIEATQHGLAAATGGLSLTGVGLMLGGGIGHLSSRAGYAADNILKVELVTATGEVVHASPNENPDLFWAVRGSTGNFGVVTSLEVRLHEIPPLVHAGIMSWPLDRLEGPVEALRGWSWCSDDCNLLPELDAATPDAPAALNIFICHSGSAEEARADLDRLRAFGAPDADTVSAVSFRELTFMFDDAFPPSRATINEQSVGALSDQLIHALVEKIQEPAGSGARFIELLTRRGALGRAPEHPSALRERAEDPTWMINPGCWWQNGSEDDNHAAWVADVIETVRRNAPIRPGSHPNTVGVTLDLDGVRRMYGDRFDRLRELKREWDPDNVFAGNHNVPPATTPDHQNIDDPVDFQ
jgi:FAD/FMN-containing dehydrogenase